MLGAFNSLGLESLSNIQQLLQQEYQYDLHIEEDVEAGSVKLIFGEEGAMDHGVFHSETLVAILEGIAGEVENEQEKDRRLHLR